MKSVDDPGLVTPSFLPLNPAGDVSSDLRRRDHLGLAGDVGHLHDASAHLPLVCRWMEWS